MVTIRRIDLASAFRVGALLTALIWLVSGIVWIGFYGMLVAPAMLYSQSSEYSMGFIGAGLGVMCVGFVGGGVFAAVAGGIGGVLTALAYNLTARWAGGLKVELEDEYSKAKRDFDL